MRRNFTLIIFFFLFYSNKVFSQQQVESEFYLNAENITDLTFLPAEPGWGYSFADLNLDLANIKSNPLVYVDTIGYSVLNRPILQVTINNYTASGYKHRIMIHTRTHPAEVQSSYVTKEIINILLSNSSLAKMMLKYCIFNIVPMINPDGVELGKLRENADNVDHEGNWATATPEPEVNSLRKLFETNMAKSNPIEIALNMHSSVNCTRYFVYHSSVGTSAAYAANEKRFISFVRSYWPDSIQNWDYMISWSTGTATVYPESWFWLNHGDKVLALTYEDMNCAQNGNYAKTAEALLLGIRNYLNLEGTDIEQLSNENSLSAYPNPVHSADILKLTNNKGFENSIVELISIDGKIVHSEKVNNSNNEISISLPVLSKGLYMLVVKSTLDVQSKRIVIQ
jgi:hypothetical protein